MYQFKTSFIASVLFIATSVRAEIKPYISTETEYNTECKTCPRSLCPNQIAYDYYDKFNVTCWTRGTKIMGDDLWLKSEAGCYVTQYDVIEYAGDYTKDLKYCGPASEVQKLTVEKSQLKYKTECRICPELSCDTMAYLKENTKVDLTCWYPDGQVIIDDPYWLKTTNNCYVAQKNLVSKPNLAKLDNCGPIPFLENLWHNNENGTSDNNRRTSHKEKRSPAPVLIPEPLPKKEAGIGLMYLVNVTVGEEYAPCRSCPQENCKAQRTYEFNNEVWLQCITRGNGTDWWSQTTDFCYVKNSDFWESPEGDYYRMPSCERFDTGGPGGDED